MLSRIVQHRLPLKNLLFLGMKRLFSSHSDFGRPEYSHCIERAFELASALKIKGITLIEFGVAGGSGLICLSKLAKRMRKKYQVDYKLCGFDMGSGLPKPESYQDRPYQFNEGFYRLDKERIQKHAPEAELVIGDIRQTLKNFCDQAPELPIGGIFFDLDYYSSTKVALQIFDFLDEDSFLPRVPCYFDDVESIESVGERLAIYEFNQSHTDKKIEHNLATRMYPEVLDWKIYEYHHFSHKNYCKQLVKRHDI